MIVQLDKIEVIRFDNYRCELTKWMRVILTSGSRHLSSIGIGIVVYFLLSIYILSMVVKATKEWS